MAVQTVHSLFDHTIPICLCDHPNEMSSHTFKINFTVSGHEHSKQPNMTSWVKINSKKKYNIQGVRKKPNSLIHFIVTELIYAITKYSLFELNMQIKINYEGGLCNMITMVLITLLSQSFWHDNWNVIKNR